MFCSVPHSSTGVKPRLSPFINPIPTQIYRHIGFPHLKHWCFRSNITAGPTFSTSGHKHPPSRSQQAQYVMQKLRRHVNNRHHVDIASASHFDYIYCSFKLLPNEGGNSLLLSSTPSCRMLATTTSTNRSSSPVVMPLESSKNPAHNVRRQKQMLQLSQSIIRSLGL